MNRITHRYYVSLQLLERLEKYVEYYKPSIDDVVKEYRRLQLFYRTGLTRLDN